MTIRPETHQSDIKELAAMKADCKVALEHTIKTTANSQQPTANYHIHLAIFIYSCASVQRSVTEHLH